MKYRKFKSKVTLYNDYEGGFIDTNNPKDMGDEDCEFAFARKGTIFTLKPLDHDKFECDDNFNFELVSNKLTLLLENDLPEQFNDWFDEVFDKPKEDKHDEKV